MCAAIGFTIHICRIKWHVVPLSCMLPFLTTQSTIRNVDDQFSYNMLVRILKDIILWKYCLIKNNKRYCFQGLHYKYIMLPVCNVTLLYVHNCLYFITILCWTSPQFLIKKSTEFDYWNPKHNILRRNGITLKEKKGLLGNVLTELLYRTQCLCFSAAFFLPALLIRYPNLSLFSYVCVM
jgi:hypothetical protein